MGEPPAIAVRSFWMASWVRRGLGAALVLLLAGCSRESGSRRAATASASASAVASAPAPAVEPPKDQELAQVRAELEAWLAAQQSLDFERYAAFYADGFRGLKRVGDRRFRFDRSGWLADRRPMFKPGLTVKASGLELVRVEQSIAVFFTQEFSSLSYRDRGRKQLLFAKASPAAGGAPGGWRIVREEMLSSEVLGGAGSVAVLPGFFFAGPDMGVLRSNVELRWLTAARRELARAFRAAVEDPENAEWPDEGPLTWADLQLPPEVTALSGKKLYVTRAPAQGATSLPPPCEVTVTKLDVINTATEIFESVRGARGHDHVYGSMVIGRFDRPCPGAFWASEAPPAPQFLPREAQGTALDAALAQLRRSAGAGKRGLGPGPSTKGQHTSAWLLGDPQAEQLLFVELSRDHWSPSFASVTALFALPVGAAAPRLLGVVAKDTSLTPLLAFDAERDGSLELLVQESDDDGSWHVVQQHAGRASATRVYFTPTFVCSG